MTIKKKRFIDLPRNKKADLAFQLKHRIQRKDNEFREFGFTSPHYIDSDCYWADFYFISKIDKHIFYNATIDSPTYKRDTQKDTMAWAEIDRLRKLHNEPYIDKFISTKVPGQPYYTVDFQSHPYKCLDGLTQIEYHKKIVGSFDPPVYEEVKKDFKYVYGIGLHITLDVPVITPVDIERFIKIFHISDEKEYKSDIPVIFK